MLARLNHGKLPGVKSFAPNPPISAMLFYLRLLRDIPLAPGDVIVHEDRLIYGGSIRAQAHSTVPVCALLCT
jgi:hypothetical protein